MFKMKIAVLLVHPSKDDDDNYFVEYVSTLLESPAYSCTSVQSQPKGT